ncbi:hypothetical protein [Clostridium sp. KNHs214]|uniref:hypothetical protein n=1 Tax=Clostridium sp. KNHs214 TaxID=1540257 RepID=UPI000559A0A4|nr:hypothetical protein [Clostridium sp. KNHs214]
MSRKFFKCLVGLNGNELEGENFIKLETDDFVKVMNVYDYVGVNNDFFNEFNYDNIEVWDNDEEIQYYMIDEDDFKYYDFISYTGDMNKDIIKILKNEIDIDDYVKEKNVTKQQLIELIKKELEENDIKKNGFETHLTYDEYVVNTNYYKLIVDDYFGDYTVEVEEIDDELQHELENMEEIDRKYGSFIEEYLYKTEKGNYYINFIKNRFDINDLPSVFGLYYKATEEDIKEFQREDV